MTTVWTDPVVSRLEELCLDPSYSNATIACVLNKEFNTEFTRNSIIGRRSRTGLISSKPARVARSTVKQERPTPRRRPTFHFAKLAPELKVHGHTAVIEMPTVFPHACGILELKNDTCRFPVGDVGSSGFFFCGTPGADFACHKPYCPAHAQIVSRRY
jgi:GcrA cell cycle regulator